MIKEFEVGEEIILKVLFRNRLNVPADPVVVIGAVKTPTGDVVDVDFVNTGTVGEWESTFTPTISGKHWWRVEGVGTVDTAQERAFRVKAEKVVIT